MNAVNSWDEVPLFDNEQAEAVFWAENRLEVREGGLAVKILGERFQVHIRGINMIVNIVKGLACDVAVAHHHRFEPV